MSKYKIGDKIVLTVTGVTEMGGYPYYVLNDNFNLWEQSIDKYSEPLTTYTEPLERKNENKQKQIEKLVDKLHRQAAEITRLLAESKELKERVEKANRTSLSGGRLAGQNEAWELAQKIACMPINGGFTQIEFEEIFDCGYITDIFEKYTYSEASSKVAEWEKAKEEIKVGDIVRCKSNTPVEFCVTEISCHGRLYGIGKNGGTYSNKNPKDWEETGRHIDIDGFLKQIGGE